MAYQPPDAVSSWAALCPLRKWFLEFLDFGPALPVGWCIGRRSMSAAGARKIMATGPVDLSRSPGALAATGSNEYRGHLYSGQSTGAGSSWFGGTAPACA